MKRYQIWKSENNYAISSLSCNSIPPENSKTVYYVTTKDLVEYKKTEVIERDMRAKNALIDYLKPIVIDDGIHPIYNRIREVCQQISNVPNRIMSSQEVLQYLNDYTILPQETPPWEEIIYKLRCYSKILTEEYYSKVGFSLDDNRELAEHEEGVISEMNKDEHYFVCRPKEDEGRKGFIFHLENPNRPRRRWIIFDEYYDFAKNAWVKGGRVIRREGGRVDPPTEPKKVDVGLLKRVKAKAQYFETDTPKTSTFDWRKIKIHPLAHLIPFPTEEERDRLRQDIKEKGVLESLWLYEGKILDGRTRYGICLELDVKPDFKSFKGPGSARSFVMSMGINRRHLTSSQIAAIGVDQYLEEFEKKARERLKTNMNGANSKKPDMNSVHAMKTEQAEKGRAANLLSSHLKVAACYIYDAKAIKEKSPEIFIEVLKGKRTITEAKRFIKGIVPVKKKRVKRKKFELEYRKMLDKIINNAPDNIQNWDKLRMLKSVSSIYLKWDKRNDKKLIKELEQLMADSPDIFSEKKRHLELLRM